MFISVWCVCVYMVVCACAHVCVCSCLCDVCVYGGVCVFGFDVWCVRVLTSVCVCWVCVLSPSMGKAWQLNYSEAPSCCLPSPIIQNLPLRHL